MRAVAHLIVVLHVCNEGGCRKEGAGFPLVAPLMLQELALPSHAFGQGPADEIDAPVEVCVVPAVFLGDDGMQGVVNIIAPLGIEQPGGAVAAPLQPSGLVQ